MKLLKGFVVEGTDIIFKSTDWECISDNNFKVGESVYLHMDGGFLHACKQNKNNEAEAIAVESAKAGNKLRIRDIKGIININFGTNSFYTLKNEVLGSKMLGLAEEMENQKKEIESLVKDSVFFRAMSNYNTSLMERTLRDMNT